MPLRSFNLRQVQMRTDREKQGLNGPVKHVLAETVRFEKSDGQIVEKPWFSHAITFNSDGQIIEQVNRNLDGSEWRSVNHYSNSGDLLATRSFDSSGAPYGELRYIYAEDGKLVAEQEVSPEGTVTTKTTYIYDDLGEKVKIQKLDFHGEGTLILGVEHTSTFVNADRADRVESRYDDRGEVVEARVFDVDGALLSRMEITRDANGNSLEEIQYYGDDVRFGSCTPDSCSTEEMEALTEEQQAELAAEVARLFTPGTVMSKHTHTYDREGRLIESKLTMMGMEVHHQTFAYDDAGNKSEEVSYGQDGLFATKAIFAREYDEHGNWITEMVSSWDAELEVSTPAHVTRRVITYW